MLLKNKNSGITSWFIITVDNNDAKENDIIVGYKAKKERMQKKITRNVNRPDPLLIMTIV